MKNQKGFTLLELLIVIVIIAIIFAVILVAIDPVTRAKEARNSTRWQEVDSILNAVLKYSVDNLDKPTGIDGTLRMLGTDGTGCDVACPGVYGGSFIDDTQTEFDAGTYNNTQWNTNHVELTGGSSSGTYASSIKDAGTSTAWGELGWAETLPTATTTIAYQNPAETLHYYSNNTYSVRTWYSTTDDFDSITPRIVLDCDGACAGTVRVRIGTASAWTDYDFIDAGTIRTDGTTSDYTYYSNNFALDSATLGNYFFVQLLHYTGSGTVRFLMDESGPAGPDPEFRVSGDGDGSQTGWTNDNGDYFMEAVLNQGTDLKFQVRSCDDAACAGEAYQGPDGTGSTYFENGSGQSVNVATNRYFQYQGTFESDNTSITPETDSVSISYDAPMPGACLNLTSDLVDTYLSKIPEDPNAGSPGKTYYGIQETAGGRLRVVSCGAELGEYIHAER